jgi:insertion element IS1 protein InsB
VAFYRVKKNKLWIIKALDRGTRRVVAWVLGRRDAATFRRLYEKVQHLKDCLYYTGDWDAFAEILPGERHTKGKKHTIAIEQDNGNTRHYLGRLTRRSKIVSKTKEMVDASIRLNEYLRTEEGFSKYQNLFVSIVR